VWQRNYLSVTLTYVYIYISLCSWFPEWTSQSDQYPPRKRQLLADARTPEGAVIGTATCLYVLSSILYGIAVYICIHVVLGSTLCQDTVFLNELLSLFHLASPLPPPPQYHNWKDRYLSYERNFPVCVTSFFQPLPPLPSQLLQLSTF
jgi:hypothetical protein